MSSGIWGLLRLIVSNVVLGVAILIFAKGFFPHKAVLSGLATWPEGIRKEVDAPFDRVIFMVVDALRSDFVYSNNSQFYFTQSLIRKGAAIPFTGHASPPTITMPRVKAITTGSVPSFLDLVLNFAESDTSSTLAVQDSWLAQLKQKPGGKLVMYGDDTWIRLFPGFFERADGTTSFFVSDFTEVDNNVTRHVPEELKNDDWNGMIMHYLGLDHIGHKTGPKGPNMPAKQKEMDEIVKQVYQAMETYEHLESSLLVLVGDHGMNEAGNHGANSPGEVSTALTFISPKFMEFFQGVRSPAKYAPDFRYYDVVDQSDVAPTLAALLGFPVPKNSLGAIIPLMFNLWPNRTDHHALLYQNAQQIQQVAYATFPEAFNMFPTHASCAGKQNLPDEQKLACKWRAVQTLDQSLADTSHDSVRDGRPLVRTFVKMAQNLLSGTASKYDERSMLIGIALALLCSWPPHSLYDKSKHNSRLALVWYFFLQVMYSITMFASSYVEEEHQFWYWISSAWLIVLAVREQRARGLNRISIGLTGSFSLCAIFGIIRRFNQTGQKYAGEADLVNQILNKTPSLLWSLVILSYVMVFLRQHLRLNKLGMRQAGILPAMVCTSACMFKLAFTAADAPELLQGMTVFTPILDFATKYPLHSLARVVFFGIANVTGVVVYCERPWTSRKCFFATLESLHPIITLFLLTQTRTTNIPLFLLFDLQMELLKRSRSLRPFEACLTMLMLQYCSFFAFGGTNAISSVDLSNAYNGVSGYSVLAVGLLTFLSNWAGPVWWTSATTCLLRSSTSEHMSEDSEFDWFGVLTNFAAVHATTVMAACYILREHLFVWTVFSPKYLYMMAWIFAQHMAVNGLFSTIISVGG